MCFLKVLNQKQVQQQQIQVKNQKLSVSSTPSFEDLEIQKAQQFLPGKFTSPQTSTDPKPDQMVNLFQFQFFMLNQLMNQNNSLTLSLIEKNERMTFTIKTLEEMIEDFKKSRTQKSQEKITQYIPFEKSNYNDILIKNIFGNQKYRYQLVLDQPFQTQLYKQRNFNIKIKLVDVEKNQVLNSNSIPLGLYIYTSDIDSEIITHNRSGQPILKGNSESQVYHGKAEFTKLHLREVTSYYRNGWIYFVIFPKASSLCYNNRESSLESVIDYNLIKPLVISEVVVRAKKK